jgi:hypothetical protein
LFIHDLFLVQKPFAQLHVQLVSAGKNGVLPVGHTGRIAVGNIRNDKRKVVQQIGNHPFLCLIQGDIIIIVQLLKNVIEGLPGFDFVVGNDIVQQYISVFGDQFRSARFLYLGFYKQRVGLSEK